MFDMLMSISAVYTVEEQRGSEEPRTRKETFDGRVNIKASQAINAFRALIAELPKEEDK